MIYVYYRISDGGYNKVKPDYITKSACLINFLTNFNFGIISIIADNVKDKTYDRLPLCVPAEHDDSMIQFSRTAYGNGAASFKHCLDLAVNRPVKSYDNKDNIVYFVEDDYLHRPMAHKYLMEGFQTGAKYVTLYDHPDKYLDKGRGGNPEVISGGEISRVFCTDSCHWKLTNSTTMTFAASVKTLQEDYDTILPFISGTHPNDFQMFLALRDKNRALVSSIPGYATHGETAWLSPLHNWAYDSNRSTILTDETK